MSVKRFAVFDCEDSAKWRGHEQLYTGKFGGSGASWDIYQCWDGKLPGLEDAEQYRGIFITGSHYSAYEDLPWINNLAEWLRSFLQRQHSTRIVAVCFGSQVMARALGGRIGRNPSQRFVLTVEELQLTEAFTQKSYFSAAASPKEQGASAEQPQKVLKLIESHGDQVLELPEGAQLLATSATAANEVWTVGDRVLAIQGHPEMHPSDALAKIHPTLSSNGRLSEAEAAASRAALEGTPPDSEIMQRIMEAFVQQGATSGSQPLPDAGISTSHQGTPAETGSSYGLPSWLPSVPMPAVSLPSLSLPAWVPGLVPSASAQTAAAPAAAAPDNSARPAASAQTPALATAGEEAPAAAPATERTGVERMQAAAQPEAQTLPEAGGGGAAGGEAAAAACKQQSEGSDTSAAAAAAGHSLGAGTPQEASAGSPGPLREPEQAASSAPDRAFHRRADLHAKVERLVDDLACAVSADLDGIAANYELLFGVNTVSRAEFLHMQQELATWQPLIKEIRRKQEACRQLSGAVEGLEGRMEAVEGSIATLDADTRHLARELGIPLDA